MSTQEIAIPDQPGEVTPEEFANNVSAARHKATTLQQIVDSQHLVLQIGASKHLRVEGWITIAAGYGLTPVIEWSRPLQGGPGFEARAVLQDSAGKKVSSAEAECGSDGDANWEGKPDYQQRSMAQTRAISKACRNKLAWVVILAGYAATPAEEMDNAELSTSEYYCAEHQTLWFKKGRMRQYAHSVQGTDPAQWCNMPKPAPESPETAAGASAPIRGDAPPSETGDTLADKGDTPSKTGGVTDVAEWSIPKNIGELFTWALKAYGLKKPDTLKLLGVEDQMAIADIGQAWQTIVYHKGQDKAREELEAEQP